MKRKSPEDQLADFMAKYEPGIAALARAVLVKLRARLPGAVELVYDNYNALVVGFSPSERPSDAILSVALYPRWVNLFFLHGANLPDPERLLKGSGKRVRSVVLEDAATLDKPAIQALIAHALKRSGQSWNSANRGRVVVKSISSKQRPRRTI